MGFLRYSEVLEQNLTSESEESEFADSLSPRKTDFIAQRAVGSSLSLLGSVQILVDLRCHTLRCF